MKPTNAFSFSHGTAWEFKSKVCSIACSIEHDYPKSDIHDRAIELTQSFFYQWLFVVSAYNKLQKSLTFLNKKSDEARDAAHITPYLVSSIEEENQFRDDAYLFIVSMKTHMDLFACVVDLAEHKKIRQEGGMPDISKYGVKIKASTKITAEFMLMRNKTTYPWINLLTEARNKLIHRGYHLKPIFGFQKSEELIVRLHKGTDICTNITNIEIGKLFEDFERDMNIIDEKVGHILAEQLQANVPIEALFKNDRLINLFSYNETEAAGNGA